MYCHVFFGPQCIIVICNELTNPYSILAMVWIKFKFMLWSPFNVKKQAKTSIVDLLFFSFSLLSNVVLLPVTKRNFRLWKSRPTHLQNLSAYGECGLFHSVICQHCSHLHIEFFFQFLTWRLPSTYPTLCYKEIRITPKIRVPGTLSKMLHTENFITAAGRSECRQ